MGNFFESISFAVLEDPKTVPNEKTSTERKSAVSEDEHQTKYAPAQASEQLSEHLSEHTVQASEQLSEHLSEYTVQASEQLSIKEFIIDSKEIIDIELLNLFLRNNSYISYGVLLDKSSSIKTEKDRDLVLSYIDRIRNNKNSIMDIELYELFSGLNLYYENSVIKIIIKKDIKKEIFLIIDKGSLEIYY